MPELPEVQTVVNGIKNELIGKKILNFTKFSHKLRYTINKKINIQTKNSLVKDIRRIAKYIIIELSNELSIVIHLGMSGRIILKKYNGTKESKHNHFIISFSDNYFLKYFDPRKFGLIDLIETKKILGHKLFNHLGVEPLSKHFNTKKLYAICNQKKSTIKTIIMNQKNIVGVGNIYASEALYISRINPLKTGSELKKEQISRLVNAIKKVLEKSIKLGGSSINDYSLVTGNLGNYQNNVRVYGRDGLKCRKKSCKSIIIRIVISNRSTFYCSKCQK
tara:strand:+ start:126 stop:956 length:831 start_codon:yes stop_codon:yes gene_type:complete